MAQNLQAASKACACDNEKLTECGNFTKKMFWAQYFLFFWNLKDRLHVYDIANVFHCNLSNFLYHSWLWCPNIWEKTDMSRVECKKSSLRWGGRGRTFASIWVKYWIHYFWKGRAASKTCLLTHSASLSLFSLYVSKLLKMFATCGELLAFWGGLRRRES